MHPHYDSFLDCFIDCADAFSCPRDDASSFGAYDCACSAACLIATSSELLRLSDAEAACQLANGALATCR